MTARAPRATRLGRLADYLNEMFPPQVNVPASLASFASVWLSLEALSSRPLRLDLRALACAVSVLFFSLLLRVYDELKDVETDLALGRAGDPRYRDRAIVTGRVQKDDLVALRWGVTALLVAINLPLGWIALSGFALAFLFTWLSYRWFFSAAVKRDLLLAFATHNPLVLVIGIYVVAVYTGVHGLPDRLDEIALLLVGSWLAVAAWETSRKVRSAADETDYQTYSKRIGWRPAAWLPSLFVAGSTACLTEVARATGLGRAYPLALALGLALMLAGSLRFRLRPSAKSANLRPLAEVYALIATVGLPLALALRYGVAAGW